ncbi:MAG: rcc01693 family protein [Pseudomonadota bacterium]|jgi:uncharacterized phage protein (TIGR02216 family)
MTPFPWVDAMRFGFGILKLSPDAFWSMTPRELAHAIHAVRGHVPKPIARAAMNDLMTRYPDTRSHANGD